MKLKENHPDAFQEQTRVPGTIQVLSLVTRAGKLSRVLEMGDKRDLSRRHFITPCMKIWQAPEVSVFFVENGQVGMLSECSIPNVFLICSFAKVYLHNKMTHSTIPGDFTPVTSPWPLALTYSPRTQTEFGFACSEE